MTRRRAAAAVATVVMALAFLPGAAPAGGRPSAISALSGGPALLVVSESLGGAQWTAIAIDPERGSATSDGLPAWRIAVESPPGTTIDLARATRGTRVGFVLALFEAEGGEGSYVPLTAEIVTDDPALYPELSRCSAEPPSSLWVARFEILGQKLNLPIALRTGSSTTLELCPAALHFEGQPVSGTIHLATAQLLLGDVLRQPTAAGYHPWRAVVTPYGLDGARADGAAFELASLVPVPNSLSFAGRYDSSTKTLVASGRVLAAGKPRAGIVVELEGEDDGGHDFEVDVRTGPQGTFSIRRKISSSTAVYASVGVTRQPCSQPTSAPGGCLLETISPPPDAEIVVAVPRKNDPRAALRSAEQALARRVGLVAGDVPAGWEFESWANPSVEGTACRAVDESRLTVKGEARSSAYSEEAGVSSHSRVFATASQGRTAFALEAREATVRCVAHKLAGDDFVVEDVHGLDLPGGPSQARGYRVAFARASGAVVYGDFVFVRAGRAVVQLTFGFDGLTPALERDLVDRVARRLQSAR